MLIKYETGILSTIQSPSYRQRELKLPRTFSYLIRSWAICEVAPRSYGYRASISSHAPRQAIDHVPFRDVHVRRHDVRTYVQYAHCDAKMIG